MMKHRDDAIDILKGMLVFGMILSHVSGLISSYNGFPIKHIWLFTGLVTFSGFVFSFGYVCQLAYFGKDLKSSCQRMVLTALKPLIAFYISGVYWRMFIDKDLGIKTVLKILFLFDIPPFSEFLISFSLMILFSLLFFQPIQKITTNKALFWTLFGFLLLTPLIPYQAIHSSHLGLLIGTEDFPAFPVLQYFPIYLLGIYFAKHRLLQDQKVLVISISGFMAFIGFYFNQHQIPGRFPPSVLWILASLFLVYVYFWIARQLTEWHMIAKPLSTWGKNGLFYLLISNILIFTFRGAYAPIALTPLESVGITLLMLLTINFLTTIVAVPKPAIAPSQEQ